MEPTVVNRSIIRYVGAFSALTDAECDALLPLVKERRLAANEVLFRQGDSGDAMVIVHHGSLSVRARRPDGYDAEVARIGSGEVLGELCCVDPAPRSASVVALAPTLVCELHAAALARMREASPGLYSVVMGAVIRDITRRAREVDARIAAIISPGAAKAPSQAPPKAPTQPPPKAPSLSPPRTPSQSPPREEPEGGAVKKFLDRLRGLS